MCKLLYCRIELSYSVVVIAVLVYIFTLPAVKRGYNVCMNFLTGLAIKKCEDKASSHNGKFPE